MPVQHTYSQAPPQYSQYILRSQNIFASFLSNIRIDLLPLAIFMQKQCEFTFLLNLSKKVFDEQKLAIQLVQIMLPPVPCNIVLVRAKAHSIYCFRLREARRAIHAESSARERIRQYDRRIGRKKVCD